MECFTLFTSPFPEVKVCVFYTRVVFALSTTKKKVIFVVIRTFLLLEMDVFVYARGVCFSYDDDDDFEQTCAETCANEPSLVFCIFFRQLSFIFITGVGLFFLSRSHFPSKKGNFLIEEAFFLIEDNTTQ